MELKGEVKERKPGEERPRPQPGLALIGEESPWKMRFSDSNGDSCKFGGGGIW